MMTNYDENKQLLQSILENNYYSQFRIHNQKNNSKKLEIFLTDICAQNCQYCYLKKHQEELYPSYLQNFDNILTNFKYIIDFYIQNKFVCDIEIFSGEWLTTSLRTPILEYLYNTFKNVPLYLRPQAIGGADNMSFIYNDIITQEIQDYINKFQKIGIRFWLSASIDGKICDFDRRTYPDEFYQKLFDFCLKNQYYCHPMISSNNIKYWKENYLWWVNNAPEEITNRLMTLEVRDETWDESSIQYLLEYYQFLINYKLEHTYNNNLLEFGKYVFNDFDNNPDHLPYQGLQIWRPDYIFFNHDGPTCGLAQHLTIRVGDLKIGLCHRTFYPELEVGQYIVKDNKIIDIKPLNVSALIIKDHFKRSCLPHCDNCKFVYICPSFCFGNAYENYKNLLIPVYENCQMYRIKYTYLILTYYNLGIFDLLDQMNLQEIEKNMLISLKNNLLEGIQTT